MLYVSFIVYDFLPFFHQVMYAVSPEGNGFRLKKVFQLRVKLLIRVEHKATKMIAQSIQNVMLR